MSKDKYLSLDLLRAFITVIDYRGFSQAGTILGLSQPAVSLKLKRLEEIVGLQLLDRSRRELNTTRAGHDLLGYARRMVSLNDEAIAALTGPVLNGHIRLGIPNEFAVSYLPQILGRFSREHPNLTLEVTCDLSTNLVAQLNQKELDITVAVHREPVTNTINTWKEELRWVASLNCTSARKPPLPLVVAPDGCVYRHRALQALASEEIDSRVVYTGTSYNGIRAAVEAGLGVTVLAKSTIPENFIFAENEFELPMLEPAYVAIHFEPDNIGDEIIHLMEYFRNAFKGATTLLDAVINPNPVLVDVSRGDIIESCHAGAYAVVDNAGNIIDSKGDINKHIYARSSLKPIQALFLLQSGAADHYRLGSKHIAIACASHSGEKQHTDLVEQWLQVLNLSVKTLECGSHRPTNRHYSKELLLKGQPITELHNNCSGKHTGFLCAAVHCGYDTNGYINPQHPLQIAVTNVIEESVEYSVNTQNPGVDGCGIPLYAIPLERLAYGFARFTALHGSNTTSQKHRHRIVDSMLSEPFYVAGTDRFCTQIMQNTGGSMVVKTGAEGVYIGMLREQGIGIALKIDDGATRASEVLMAHLLSQYCKNDAQQAYLRRASNVEIKNVAGAVVGKIGPRLD